MKNSATIENLSLSLVIVEDGKGSQILSESKRIGVTGGTIFLGKGTIKNQLLRFLGLDESKKEIVLMITPNSLCNDLHEGLLNKFQMHKPGHGIILTHNVKKLIGSKAIESSGEKGECKEMTHEVIYTIVERGIGQQVIDAASDAGSTGGTIICARGSGIHEHVKFFAMDIEPEKEIVMIITEKEKTEDIIDAIYKSIHAEVPGNGIIFTMDANRVTGLYSGE